MDKSGALVTPLKSLKLQLPSRSFLCQPGAHGVHQGFGANALLTNLLKMFEGGICGTFSERLKLMSLGQIKNMKFWLSWKGCNGISLYTTKGTRNPQLPELSPGSRNDDVQLAGDDAVETLRGIQRTHLAIFQAKSKKLHVMPIGSELFGQPRELMDGF